MSRPQDNDYGHHQARNNPNFHIPPAQYGKGNAKAGYRKSTTEFVDMWKQDYWEWWADNLTEKEWLIKFCGYSQSELMWFFDQIKQYIECSKKKKSKLIMERERRNKFL